MRKTIAILAALAAIGAGSLKANNSITGAYEGTDGGVAAAIVLTEPIRESGNVNRKLITLSALFCAGSLQAQSWSTRNGNTTWYSDGTWATRNGNTTWFSDGTWATRNGNTTWYSYPTYGRVR
jgi:hypothetical protein